MAKKDKTANQAHGQSAEFYEELQRKQHNGEVEMTVPNNVKNVTDRWLREDIEANPEMVLVAEHERGFYHLLMEDRSFTARGERLSKSFVQKYSVQQFNDTQNSHHGWLGKIVEIVHDPTKEKGVAKMTASPGGASKNVKAPEKQPETPKEKAPVSAETLTVKSIGELKALAKERNVSLAGAKTKAQIIDKLSNSK